MIIKGELGENRGSYSNSFYRKAIIFLDDNLTNYLEENRILLDLTIYLSSSFLVKKEALSFTSWNNCLLS